MPLSKPKRQNLYIFLVALLALTIGFLHVAIPIFAKKIELQILPSGPLPSQPIITKQDLAPLPIPQTAKLNGKVLLLPVLMYHHIGDLPQVNDAIRRGLTVSPQNFAAQVAWVKSQGYTSVTFAELWNYASKKNPLPKKPIIFSFDDGYDDVFTNAVPILEKFGYSGTFAIITQNPGTHQGTNTYATWAQIKLAETQGMEIVCHTQNHFDGSNKKFTPDYIYANLSGCQKDLVDHLGSAEPFLIYPYGHYSPVYIEQAKKAGFTMAFTVHEGKYVNLEDLFEIPRVRVGGTKSFEEFKKNLE
jgi:peptidoglycan/xylan/chitin deacetylase (PgdA/CDA1 family)